MANRSGGKRRQRRRFNPLGGSRSIRLAVALLVSLPLVEGAALSQDANPAPDVGLDRLLQLPDSFDSGGEDRRGGATASDWRGRFRAAREDLDKARRGLEDAQKELEGLAGESGGYQVTAPGTTNPQNSPISFKLRQEIRRQTEAVEAAEKALRALEVEADLAGIPEDWRE